MAEVGLEIIRPFNINDLLIGLSSSLKFCTRARASSVACTWLLTNPVGYPTLCHFFRDLLLTHPNRMFRRVGTRRGHRDSTS